MIFKILLTVFICSWTVMYYIIFGRQNTVLTISIVEEVDLKRNGKNYFAGTHTYARTL